MKHEPLHGQIERMKAILQSHDIEMGVGGCGCCGSPWVSFIYKGEVIINLADDCDFYTSGIPDGDDHF